MTLTAREEQVLILAPAGDEAIVAADALEQHDIATRICPDVPTLLREARPGTGALLLAEEAVELQRSKRLIDFIAGQPSWSDLPVVLIAAPRAPGVPALHVLESCASLGNVTLLERPVRLVPLVSAVQTALRGRRRQYEVRNHLAERRRADREHQRLLAAEQVARAAVEAANRAKDDFLAVLSHELRTPLQSMLGWLRVLRSGGLDAPAATRALETIERNTRAQAQLIEDLLDVSRIVAGKLRIEMRPVAVRSVIEAALESVRAGAEARRITLEADLEVADVEVDGDAVRVQQIVWNLLSNAVKFTPDGGHVHVTLRRDGGLAVITVRDDGRGIPGELLPQIFQRFRQADASNTRAHGGLGLGLAIVRHLVEMHGGSIEAASAGANQGSVFTVRLPVRASRASEMPARGSVGAWAQLPLTGGPLLEGLSLLVVDDDAGARELLAMALQNEAARVTTAGSVAEALACLERERPDVIVSDISMPGEDG